MVGVNSEVGSEDQGMGSGVLLRSDRLQIQRFPGLQNGLEKAGGSRGGDTNKYGCPDAPPVNRRLGGGQRASAPRTRAATTYLRGCEDSLPAGHHLIPLVMQHVHEAVRLVATHEL